MNAMGLPQRPFCMAKMQLSTCKSVQLGSVAVGRPIGVLSFALSLCVCVYVCCILWVYITPSLYLKLLPPPNVNKCTSQPNHVMDAQTKQTPLFHIHTKPNCFTYTATSKCGNTRGILTFHFQLRYFPPSPWFQYFTIILKLNYHTL